MRKLFKFLLLTFSLLAVLGVLAIAGLHTAPGMRLLASTAESLVADEDGNGIRITGLNGTVSQLKADKVELYDAEGVWLEITKAEIDITFMKLLSGDLEVTAILANRANLMRMPLAKDNDEEDKGGLELDDLAMILGIREISIKEFDFSEGVFGDAQALSFLFKQQKEPNTYGLSLKSLRGPETKLEGLIQHNGKLSVALELDAAPRSILHNVLGISDESQLFGTINASGDKTAWQARGEMMEGNTPLLRIDGSGKEESDDVYVWQGATIAYRGVVVETGGRFDADKETLALNGKMVTNSLTPLGELLGVKLEGPADIVLEGSGPIASSKLRLQAASPALKIEGQLFESFSALYEGSADLRSLTTGSPVIAINLLKAEAMLEGEKVALEGKGSFTREAVQLDPVTVSYAGDTASGSFAYLNKTDMVDTKLKIPAIPVHDGVTLTASLSAKGDVDALPFAIEGSLEGLHSAYADMPELLADTAQFEAKGMYASEQDQVKLDELTLTSGNSALKGSGVYEITTEHFNGSASLNAGLEGETLKASTDIATTPESITLDKIKATGLGIDADGAIKVATADNLAEGKIQLAAESLSRIGSLLGVELEGKGNATLALTRSGSAQGVKLDGKFSDFSAYGSAAESVAVDAVMADVSRLVTAKGMVTLKGLDAEGYVSEETRIAISPISSEAGQKVAVELSTRGMAGGNALALDGDAIVSEEADFTKILLRKLAGNYAEKEFALKASSNITIRENGYEVSPSRLSLGDGELTLSGSQKPGSVNAELKISQLPPSFLPEPYASIFTGSSINGTASLSGTPERPLAKYDLTADMKNVTPSLQLHGEGQVTHERFTLNGRIDSTETLAEADLAFPLRFALQPFVCDIADNAALSGKAEANIKMEKLREVLLAYGHDLQGQLNGSATISGTLTNPVIRADAAMTQATYHNRDYGICLQPFDLKLNSVDSQTLALAISSVNESQNATFDTNARFAMASGSVDGTIKLREYPLLCSNEVSGIVSGDVSATGNQDAAKIEGELTVSPVTLNIGDVSGKSIPSIPLRTDEKKAPPPDMLNNIALNVKVDIPNRMYVRGKGLDAEFSGNILVAGTAADPRLDGKVSVVRGMMEVLDRNLSIDKGVVKFSPDTPPEPQLDVAANTKVDGTTIKISLSGTADKPSLGFSSSPSLPEDEVLSLFLFGRDLSTITPFQAARLASAARELAGEGGSVDPSQDILNAASELLGVDSLSVDTTDGTDASLTAGKYISDKVFVGIKQGAEAEDRTVTTEIELTPSIGAEATVDAQGQQGIGLEWQYDY